jgi:crossover junction endodeoxyribonuclease RuvC
MLILGIDPGSRTTGYAVIEVKGRKLSYVASGTLRFDQQKDFINRLGLIYDACTSLIKQFEPDEIALESLIYVKSVTSLAKLAQARGAMIAAFMQTHFAQVSEYSPNLIKTTVSGHGHANKESIDKAMKLIFGKQLTFKTNDESDALAIAVCHSFLRGQQVTNMKSSSKGRSLSHSLKHLES